VNVAMSADGKLSTKERRQVIISGKEDFSRVDELKAGCDAIMVGIGTVLADDPSLTVKSETRVKERRSNFRPPHPIRIVVDSMARTPLGAKILHKGEGKRIIAVSRAADPVRVDQLRQVAMHSSDDIEIECIFCGEDQVDLVELCKELKMRDIHTLMVEGGGTLIMGLFQVGLIDELHTFIGNMIIGGKNAPTLADGDGFVFENEFIRLTLHTVSQMEDGVLVSWYVHGCS
jgi:2,5-diamino-6-(ribosylamino)-4(3H)-pyrimidinone 5'-phosphate reductase